MHLSTMRMHAQAEAGNVSLQLCWFYSEDVRAGDL